MPIVRKTSWKPRAKCTLSSSGSASRLGDRRLRPRREEGSQPASLVRGDDPGRDGGVEIVRSRHRGLSRVTWVLV